MSVSSESVAGTVGEVLQQKLQVLFGGLQPGLTFQSEGAEGGKLIYPQATGGAGFLYYPTFSSFNRQVEFNASGNANVFQLSPSELTVYLQSFYATLVDQLSSQAQAQLSEDRQNQNKKIQLLFGNLIPGLGVQSDLWNDLLVLLGRSLVESESNIVPSILIGCVVLARGASWYGN